MVPEALVKKMYGPSIIIDVVNRIVSKQLEKHIKDNSLSILGQPIPTAVSSSKKNKADWENPADFSFWFEVAFVPTLSFSLKDTTATYYDIQADDETIDRQIESLKTRFASDEKEVTLDDDFFKKAFPDGSVNSEKEMREKIRADIEQFYTYDADRVFSKNVFTAIAEKTDTGIPKEFLSRWIEFHNEGKELLSKEQIENHFDEYDNSLKKQLIESQIIKEEGIKIEKEDLRTFYKEDVLSKYYPPDPENPAIQEQIEEITDGALAEQKNVHQLYDMLLDKRILAVFKEKVEAKHEKITFNKFMEIAYGAVTKPHNHKHEHEQDNANE
jgi:FKBP-type peptidyl-prolyl cis-trans isomerase (trigger factor)